MSEGTLRYLLWVAALLSPRPSSLLVLNEPETSLHSDLLPSLARLIVDAANRTQVVAVSHSIPLITAIRSAADDLGGEAAMIELTKDFGETKVVGAEMLDEPPWRWPKR